MSRDWGGLLMVGGGLLFAMAVVSAAEGQPDNVTVVVPPPPPPAVVEPAGPGVADAIGRAAVDVAHEVAPVLVVALVCAAVLIALVVLAKFTLEAYRVRKGVQYEAIRRVGEK